MMCKSDFRRQRWNGYASTNRLVVRSMAIQHSTVKRSTVKRSCSICWLSPQIAAPGGDGVYQLSSAAQNGEVLSTWPSASALSDGADYPLLNDGVGGHYGYLQVGLQPDSPLSHSRTACPPRVR